MQQTLRISSSNIVSKALLAVTGLVLFGFVIAHMLGNLQIYLGREAFNHYAETLKGMPALLWGARLVLGASVVAHIFISMRLVADAAEARPQAYYVQKSVVTTYAARTMRWSGPLLAAFILFHLAHFTWPGFSVGSYAHDPKDVYGNFVNGFSVPWVVLLYAVSQVLLGLHLYHGGWSLMQSLGLSHPRYNSLRQAIPRTVAMLVVAGNLSMPLAVLMGLVKL